MKRQIISWSLVFVWMAVIFFFSSQPADESGNLSSEFSKLVCSIFVPNFNNLTTDQQNDMASGIDFGVRKAAHAFIYFVLGILVFNALKPYPIKAKRRLALTVFIGMLYASSDEFHQFFVQGRACRLTDVLIDTGGVTLGTFLNFFYTVRKSNRQKH